MIESMTDQMIIAKAKKLLFEQAVMTNILSDSTAAIDFFKIHHHQEPFETFSVAFLDTQLRLLSHDVVFNGSIVKCHVHARTLAQMCMKLNSNNILLCHHHPLGVAFASDDDKLLTTQLSKALAMLDINVVEHIILSGSDAFSFQENNLIV